MHTAQPLVPEPSASEVKITIEKLKRYKSPVINQIPTELIQTEGNKLCNDIHKLTNSNWNMEQLPQQWKESIIVSIYIKRDNTDFSNYRGISLLPTTYKILSNILFQG
jgi:hypothetical protein